MPLLELKDIVKAFSGNRALDGVSLSLEPGEIHAVCGENGAGKSTLLKVLAGCYPHGSFDGQLLLDGQAQRFQSPGDAERAGVVLVAQELSMVPMLSVAENIGLGREPGAWWGIDWERNRQRAVEAMAKVGLDEAPDIPVERLSVGKQQMVEIARAVTKQARVLILDEPTAALTESDVARLLSLVKSIAAFGIGILYVSHRLDEVFALADKITVLRDGKTVASGPRAEWDRQKVVAAMVGRELAAVEATAPYLPPSGRKALQVRDWCVERDDVKGLAALKDISFSVDQGEILGIGGLMGSGRTALLSSLFGDIRSQASGEIALADGVWRPGFRSPGDAIRAGLCLLSEDRKRRGVVPEASVKENILLAGLQGHCNAWGGLDWADLGALAEGQRKAMRVKAPSLEAPASSLSGGNQQKMLLGRWLLLAPKILLLDEPTRGIDVGAKAEIYTLIRSLAEQGLAVVVASSDLPELLALSQRILVLSQGRVSTELHPEDFSPEAVMHAATA